MAALIGMCVGTTVGYVYGMLWQWWTMRNWQAEHVYSAPMGTQAPTMTVWSGAFPQQPDSGPPSA
jgi:hypothetical protein